MIDLTVLHPTNRLYDHSVNQLASIHVIRPIGYTTIPSFDWHQLPSIAQGLHPGLGHVAPSALAGGFSLTTSSNTSSLSISFTTFILLADMDER